MGIEGCGRYFVEIHCRTEIKPDTIIYIVEIHILVSGFITVQLVGGRFHIYRSELKNFLALVTNTQHKNFPATNRISGSHNIYVGISNFFNHCQNL